MPAHRDPWKPALKPEDQKASRSARDTETELLLVRDDQARRSLRATDAHVAERLPSDQGCAPSRTALRLQSESHGRSSPRIAGKDTMPAAEPPVREAVRPEVLPLRAGETPQSAYWPYSYTIRADAHTCCQGFVGSASTSSNSDRRHGTTSQPTPSPSKGAYTSS